MDIKSLKYTPEEAKGETDEAQETKAPLYPYGLTIFLDTETLAKLGITTQPAIGTKLKIAGTAEVTGYSERKNQDAVDKYLDLQITDLGCESEGSVKSAGQTIYGGG